MRWGTGALLRGLNEPPVVRSPTHPRCVVLLDYLAQVSVAAPAWHTLPPVENLWRLPEPPTTKWRRDGRWQVTAKKKEEPANQGPRRLCQESRTEIKLGQRPSSVFISDLFAYSHTCTFVFSVCVWCLWRLASVSVSGIW